MSDEQAKSRVQQQFGAIAANYVDSPGHSKGSDLQDMVALAELRGDERVLDIATGGGHTALAFAPHVREVVATDLTPQMLAAAEAFIRSRGATNVLFELADAEKLPFPEQSFDVVTVRIAPHHFPNPAQFVVEVARVLRNGGIFVFDDNIAPEEPAAATFLNRLEQWRDPSHIRCLSVAEWQERMHEAGLRVVHTTPFYTKLHDFADWTARSNMAPAERDALEAWIQAEPAALRQQFDIVVEAGRVMTFRGDAVVIVARKEVA